MKINHSIPSYSQPLLRSWSQKDRGQAAVSLSQDTFVGTTKVETGMLVDDVATPQELASAHQILVSMEDDGLEQQVLHEIASIPQYWRNMLIEDGVRAVVLASGEHLLDSPWMKEKALSDTDTLLAGAQERWDAQCQGLGFSRESLREAPLSELDKHFAYKELRRAWPGMDNCRVANMKPGYFEKLLDSHTTTKADRQQWTEAFKQLNKTFLDKGESMIGAVLCPPPCHRGSFYDREDYGYAKQKTGAIVEQSLGLHNNDHRLVLVGETYARTDSKDFGWYRTTLHELGHAMDYAFGRRLSGHNDRVAQLYQLAQTKNGQGLWLSDRADDDVREYFAEGIEAYLTHQNSREPMSERGGVSREELKRRDPQLFRYIESLVTQEWTAKVA